MAISKSCKSWLPNFVRWDVSASEMKVPNVQESTLDPMCHRLLLGLRQQVLSKRPKQKEQGTLHEKGSR